MFKILSTGLLVLSATAFANTRSCVGENGNFVLYEWQYKGGAIAEGLVISRTKIYYNGGTLGAWETRYQKKSSPIPFLIETEPKEQILVDKTEGKQGITVSYSKLTIKRMNGKPIIEGQEEKELKVQALCTRVETLGFPPKNSKK